MLWVICTFFIEVWLIYSVSVFGVQQNDSVIYTHIYILFHKNMCMLIGTILFHAYRQFKKPLLQSVSTLTFVRKHQKPDYSFFYFCTKDFLEALSDSYTVLVSVSILLVTTFIHLCIFINLNTAISLIHHILLMNFYWKQKTPLSCNMHSFDKSIKEMEYRRNGIAIIMNKRVQNARLGCNLKNDRMISVRFQGKQFNITVIQLYALTSNAEEAEVEWFYEDLQDLLELTPKKDVHFIRGLECKSRESRNTWSNRKIWPWSTE